MLLVCEAWDDLEQRETGCQVDEAALLRLSIAVGGEAGVGGRRVTPSRSESLGINFYPLCSPPPIAGVEKHQPHHRQCSPHQPDRRMCRIKVKGHI